MIRESRERAASFAARVGRVNPSPVKSAEVPAPAGIDLGASANEYAPEDGVLLAYASQTGFIDEVAEITRRDLESVGIPVRLVELDDWDTRTLGRTTPVLIMTSTTGSGDAPFAAELFSNDVMAELAELSHLRFGLLCAGDLSYENFCGFGHRLRDWLLASGAYPLFEPINVDCEDERAIEQWRRCVVQAFSAAEARST